MAYNPHPALAARTRVVAVPIPRSDSACGKVLAFLDANTGALMPEEIAERLGMDVVHVRQTISDLRTRGLLERVPLGWGNLFSYRVAADLSAHVPAEALAEVAAGAPT